MGVSPCTESVSSFSLAMFSLSLWLCSSCSESSIVSSSVSPCSESVSSYSTPIPLCIPFLLIGGIDTVVGIFTPFCPAYIFVGRAKIVELIFKFEESLCVTYVCSFKDHSKGWRNVQCVQVNMFIFKNVYIHHSLS